MVAFHNVMRQHACLLLWVTAFVVVADLCAFLLAALQVAEQKLETSAFVHFVLVCLNLAAWVEPANLWSARTWHTAKRQLFGAIDNRLIVIISWTRRIERVLFRRKPNKINFLIRLATIHLMIAFIPRRDVIGRFLMRVMHNLIGNDRKLMNFFIWGVWQFIKLFK